MSLYYVFPGLRERAKRKVRYEKSVSAVGLEERIIDTICRHYNTSLEAISTSCRDRELVFIRQVAMTTLYGKAKMSLKNIGERFGGRHYTTVIHARQAISDFLDTGYRKDEILYFLNYDY